MCDARHNDHDAMSPAGAARAIPVSEAVGMVLAHDVTEIRKNEFKGPAFRKGHVIRHEDHIAVTTGSGLLALELIQREGKKPMAPSDFSNGHPDFIGTILK